MLTRDPEYGIYRDGVDGARNYAFGAEYEIGSFQGYWSTVYNHDISCSVCPVRNRFLVKMFLGKRIH